MNEDFIPTSGEILFENYLTHNKLTWMRNPNLDGKRPDFLVHVSNGVYCEVKDFGETEQYKQQYKAGLEFLKNKTGDSSFDYEVAREISRLTKTQSERAQRWSPTEAIQAKIKEAGKQLKPAKGKYHCLLVLHNPTFLPNEHDLVIRISIGSSKIFPKSQSTTISALAVIENYFPNRPVLAEALDQECRNLKREGNFGGAELERLATFESEFKAKFDSGFFEIHEPRLRIYKNPNAVVPIEKGLFCGKFDEEFDVPQNAD